MALDQSGWMPDTEQVRTAAWGYPDVAEDSMYAQAVVSHVAQGYMAGLLGIAQSSAPGKSWHFSVGRDGRIVQHVSIWDPAWHAGIVNGPTWALYPRLAAELGANPNRYTVGIEQEGFSIPPGYGFDYVYDVVHPWPDAQIASVIAIHQWVFRMCSWLEGKRDADHVITHSMIDTASRPQDPGDLWLATVRPRIIAALSSPAPPAAPQSSPAAALNLEGARADLRAALVKLGG